MSIQIFDNLISNISNDGMVLKNDDQLTLNVKKYDNITDDDMKVFYNWMSQVRSKIIDQKQDNYSMFSALRSVRSNEMPTMDYYDMLIEPESYEEFINQTNEVINSIQTDEYPLNIYRNIIGRQFVEAIKTDKALVDYLDNNINNENTRKSLKQIFGDNLRTGFTFGNNYDCLFQSTFGIFTALWHQSEINTQENKRVSFNGDQLERLYNEVIKPFKNTNIYQKRDNKKMLRYYNRVITSRNKIGNTLEDHLDLANKLKSTLLLEDAKNYKKFLNILKNKPSYTIIDSHGQKITLKFPGFQTMIINFIKTYLKSTYTNTRTYNNNVMTILEYYELKIKETCGEAFEKDFNIVFNAIEDSYINVFKKEPKNKNDKTKFEKMYNDAIKAFKAKYEHSINVLVNHYKTNIKDTYELYTIRNDNRIEDIILMDYDETTKISIKTFINGAINYIRDLISGLDYDNFVFSSMAYRCTCILLIYWFIPIEILQRDNELQYIFWDVNDPTSVSEGEEYKSKEYAKRGMIGIPLSVSFDDANIRYTEHDALSGHVNYKTYMVFNEVFTSIAMNLFPNLINVDHISGKYNTINGENIVRPERNVLYIIRPTLHDHTYTIARINDEIFWCDDVYCKQRFINAFLKEHPNNVDKLSTKLITDLHSYYNKIIDESDKQIKNAEEAITKAKKKADENGTEYVKPKLPTNVLDLPTYIYYQNNDSVYFVHYMFSSNYNNVVRIKISYDKFNEIVTSDDGPYSEADIDDTKTNQIYGRGKSNKVMEMILLVLKIITFTLIIVILVVEILKIIRRKSDRNIDRHDDIKSFRDIVRDEDRK